MQNNLEPSLSINFSKEKEEGYKRIFKRSPLVSSMSVGWNDLVIAYDQYPPGEIPKISVKQHCLGIYTNMPSFVQTERTINGRLVREQNIQGDCVIVPANTSHQVAWNHEGGALTIAINPTVFAQTIYEVVDPDCVELLPQFATPDPLIYQIGVALKSVLTKHGTSSRLYAETLINALILHLLEHYSTNRPNLSECIAGKLPKYKLQQVIDYIYAYLDRDLSLKELGTVVQMSPQYFSQLFKETTGITPHQYVIRCRIERAKGLLKQGLSIAETATQVGFVDQSHLHRHFKRLMGVTPKTFSQQFKKRKN
ncbi:AraC family transcriptional regulator [Pleurocapsa sp. PCC 7319]|uniref:helix-turn-helix domain-containing protein n=1 Tax=Pleurocapsa sp. PCC 7319 TaxID=118161 RepID=UPI0003472709|nr:AraC family transcriptional regulator [Pleurocapsa sp. PCC 7319]